MPSTVLFLSSDPAAGAVNVSPDGSSFDVVFQPPMKFPRDSRPSIAVTEAGVIWSVHNLSAALGNNQLWYTTNIAIPTMHNVTLVDGLYTLGELQSEINRAVVVNGHPDGLIGFIGVEATGRVYLTISEPGWHVSFGDGPSIGTMLGHTSLGVPMATPTTRALTTAAKSTAGSQSAILNTVTSILVHSTLAMGSSIVGGTASSAICTVSPDVDPGSQILLRPNIPLEIECAHLAGATVDRASFRLTDQTARFGTINTNGEYFRVVLRITY